MPMKYWYKCRLCGKIIQCGDVTKERALKEITKAVNLLSNPKLRRGSSDLPVAVTHECEKSKKATMIGVADLIGAHHAR